MSRLNEQYIKHGFSRKGKVAPEYLIWTAMKQRCLNPKTRRFKDYGGRGISICERWIASFENFLTDMGRRPPGLTLERIDNLGGYEPSNCKWATRSEQMRNRRPSKKREFSKAFQNLAIGISRQLASWRMKRGWTREDAITIPPTKSKSHARKI